MRCSWCGKDFDPATREWHYFKLGRWFLCPHCGTRVDVMKFVKIPPKAPEEFETPAMTAAGREIVRRRKRSARRKERK